MRISHAPAGYDCPFCRLVNDGEKALTTPYDIVRRTPGAIAFMAPRWWPANHGNVLVIPTGHYENLYELPAEAGHAVHDLTREIAVAVRETYGCTGVSTRQHNEPHGNQDVWHYHMHVFPRYADDGLYGTRPYPEFVTAEQRRPYAAKLHAYFAAQRSREGAREPVADHGDVDGGRDGGSR